MLITSLPWGFVRNHLVEREAAPLSASSYSFIKERFGISLGDVPVFAGPAASRLCDFLQARALVVNRNLVWGSGHLVQTSSHQRVLAHEIVHLIQSQQHQKKLQRSESVLVGEPQAPYELEADLIAEEVMNGRAQSTPTPDLSGAIRRSFTILPNATMEATYRGATPAVSYVRRGTEPFVVLHLTRNSAGIVADSARKPSDISAIRITANISVQSDNPREDLASSDLRFRFVQFFALTDKRAYYAGSSSGDGNIYVDFASRPAFSGEGDLMLDSEAKSTIFPYFEMYPPQYRRVNPSLWNVTIAMDDHPFSNLPLRLSNFYTKKAIFYALHQRPSML